MPNERFTLKREASLKEERASFLVDFAGACVVTREEGVLRALVQGGAHLSLLSLVDAPPLWPCGVPDHVVAALVVVPGRLGGALKRDGGGGVAHGGGRLEKVHDDAVVRRAAVEAAARDARDIVRLRHHRTEVVADGVGSMCKEKKRMRVGAQEEKRRKGEKKKDRDTPVLNVGKHVQVSGGGDVCEARRIRVCSSVRVEGVGGNRLPARYAHRAGEGDGGEFGNRPKVEAVTRVMNSDL
eukprot:6200816-Pleurochrysis_carterae.AAC.2